MQENERAHEKGESHGETQVIEPIQGGKFKAERRNKKTDQHHRPIESSNSHIKWKHSENES